MITYIRLCNFKSFHDVIFDFRKGKKNAKRFAAVYGENGSGKSNFVDSIAFLRHSLESFHLGANAEKLQSLRADKNIANVLLPEDVMRQLADAADFGKLVSSLRMTDCEEPTTIECGFKYKEHIGIYTLSFMDGFSYEKLYYFSGKQSGTLFELTLEGDQIKSSFSGNFFGTAAVREELENIIRQYWGKHTLLGILQHEREEKNLSYIKKSYTQYVYDVIDMLLKLTAVHSNKARGGIEANFLRTDRILPGVSGGTVNKRQVTVLDRTERILNDFFTQAYPDIKQVFYTRELQGEDIIFRLFVKKMIAGKIRTIDFNNESAGTIQVLNIISSLLGAFMGGTVVFDEIDAGIHDLLLKTIITSMQKWITGQLIITTHNTYLMETLDTKSVYIINSDYLGNKAVNCINDFERIRGTNNPRNMYIKGMFGGVPIADEIEYGAIVNELQSSDDDFGEGSGS